MQICSHVGYSWPYIVLAYMGMAYVVMAYIGMAYIVMACLHVGHVYTPMCTRVLAHDLHTCLCAHALVYAHTHAHTYTHVHNRVYTHVCTLVRTHVYSHVRTSVCKNKIWTRVCVHFYT